MNDIAIRVEGLSKKFHIGKKQETYKTLRDSITDALVSPFRKAGKLLRGQVTGAAELDETIWALKDISFQVKQGEAVGIIGRNGAGKSTLLKILSRITEPTTGFAEIYGRMGSLLEVGTGFHQELTGRENIYLNGAILGMKRAEIDRNFDEIVAFSEVEKFIDTPVKHYSSGMYLRLAFAVAAHLEPEILLVDEVLAVGDLEFQKRCLGKMQDIAGEGRTVFFVSHNMSAITQLCERVLYLEGGRLKLSGFSADVVSSYLSSGTEACATWTPSSDRINDSEFQVKSARVVNRNSQLATVVEYDSQFTVEIEYEVVQPIKDLSLIFHLIDSQGNVIFTSWNTDHTGWKSGKVSSPGRYLSICKIPGSLLKPGLYRCSIGARSSDRRFDYHEKVLAFEVSEVGYKLPSGRVGIITPLLEWEGNKN